MEAIEKQYPWQPDLDETAARLHVSPEDEAAFADLFRQAVATFAPRVFAREVTIDALGDDFALLSGEWFEGTRLAALLGDARRVWAFVATAGQPPQIDPDDPLAVWWLQKLGEDAVHDAMARFTAEMNAQAEAGTHVNTISPGSLVDWPITQQRPLFSLLGEKNAGVSLTDACLMLPRCSVSGLLFAAPQSFCSCAHCPMGHCPNRRAPQLATNANA
ncbi:MAG: hypothetical protein LBN04_08365 [Oscillospiraceae bacterium]|jgi:NAD(P)-dependent dehydrogenase (short-subunit alcohol dehydrogenase family)|nr:hypothetical protein [Oscillospiraceae bacterium]